MGMDIYGNSPDSDSGEYFRSNLWYWRPLWGMIEYLYPQYSEKVPSAYFNDGDGLNKKDSYDLSQLIKADIESGLIEKYVNNHMEFIKTIPQDDCQYCSETGYRLWPDSQTGFVTQSICNVCNGTLKTNNWQTNYCMDYDFVKEFQIFMQHSGGFKIW